MERSEEFLNDAEAMRGDLANQAAREIGMVLIACTSAIVVELVQIREELAGLNQGVTGL